MINHILLQYILSISIKGTLPKEIGKGVYHLALLLRCLCSGGAYTIEELVQGCDVLGQYRSWAMPWYFVIYVVH